MRQHPRGQSRRLTLASGPPAASAGSTEHPIRVIKWPFGHVKVCYRGRAKNGAQVLPLFALSNRWMTRRGQLAATRR